MSEDYKGSRYEMILMGSGWLKQTKTGRKLQRFVINHPIQMIEGDVLVVFIAKTKKNANSPDYYIFHDINARKSMKSKKTEDPDPAPVEHDEADDF